MTSTKEANLTFTPPRTADGSAVHHARAAAHNAAVAREASGQLLDALSGSVDLQRILLKAAAGAGKSYVLKQLVEDAIAHVRCVRVAVVAFQNRQLWPIAESLGRTLGADRVCLLSGKDRYADVPDSVRAHAVVVTSSNAIPKETVVVVATSHRLGAIGERSRLLASLGPGANGEAPFDVLFVDEAWQLANHLFARVEKSAPLVVGVGDVGQLPPLETGSNPWRGDPSYNPYRAWPTGYDGDVHTWSAELPTVWRPAAEQLPLWRAFYPEWGELDCVAAPDDRAMAIDPMVGLASAVWDEVATCRPLLLEVDGLEEPEAPDVDLPLVTFAEDLLDALFAAGFALWTARYDDAGSPTGEIIEDEPGGDSEDPLVAFLATRNQAVDDATDAVERLRERHGLSERDLLASTVDSWQGQTNRITVAVHPLTGATQLDEFNSAFGRLAVACTRATHGLLILSRPGLDAFLVDAPARPGTPFGEPGNRHLPRQTHQRIINTFARGRVSLSSAAT